MKKNVKRRVSVPLHRVVGPPCYDCPGAPTDSSCAECGRKDRHPAPKTTKKAAFAHSLRTMLDTEIRRRRTRSAVLWQAQGVVNDMKANVVWSQKSAPNRSYASRPDETCKATRPGAVHRVNPSGSGGLSRIVDRRQAREAFREMRRKPVHPLAGSVVRLLSGRRYRIAPDGSFRKLAVQA